MGGFFLGGKKSSNIILHTNQPTQRKDWQTEYAGANQSVDVAEEGGKCEGVNKQQSMGGWEREHACMYAFMCAPHTSVKRTFFQLLVWLEVRLIVRNTVASPVRRAVRWVALSRGARFAVRVRACLRLRSAWAAHEAVVPGTWRA